MITFSAPGVGRGTSDSFSVAGGGVALYDKNKDQIWYSVPVIIAGEVGIKRTDPLPEERELKGVGKSTTEVGSRKFCEPSSAPKGAGNRHSF